jgi:hypothetical protein
VWYAKAALFNKQDLLCKKQTLLCLLGNMLSGQRFIIWSCGLDCACAPCFRLRGCVRKLCRQDGSGCPGPHIARCCRMVREQHSLQCASGVENLHHKLQPAVESGSALCIQLWTVAEMIGSHREQEEASRADLQEPRWHALRCQNADKTPLAPKISAMPMT